MSEQTMNAPEVEIKDARNLLRWLADNPGKELKDGRDGRMRYKCGWTFLALSIYKSEDYGQTWKETGDIDDLYEYTPVTDEPEPQRYPVTLATLGQFREVVIVPQGDLAPHILRCGFSWSWGINDYTAVATANRKGWPCYSTEPPKGEGV